ncbi:hypothetical protein OBBRIDRAFT_648813 [Obba rivulosa]|uniref:Protein kinase domain-containing protein n=1 Tax=Obba rivulosa TaxID=1052685 RepID=A0A8E2ARS4_9APHY|nr:hypothetical protein OBBRIDRAFT_648813 [Obba rivulosa]
MLAIRHSLNTSDVLANVIAALETLSNASSVISAVPFLGAVLNSVLSLVTAIQKVKGEKERCAQLAKRALDLMTCVEEYFSANADAIDGDLVASHSLSAISRFFRRDSLSAKLDNHLNNLDDARRLFILACIIALRQASIRQERYGIQGLRLFRLGDLELCRVRSIRNNYTSAYREEWEGRLDGRAVIIRILHQKYSGESVAAALVKRINLCDHPYVVQILGYSHPSSRTNFYVMEAGSVNALPYLTTKDSKAKLRWYLQLFVDYEHLYSYLQSQQFPVARCPQVHIHTNCLSSFSLKEDGTLMLPAEDLENANLYCLQYRLGMLFHHCHQQATSISDDSPYEPIAESARALLSTLDEEHSYADGLRRHYDSYHDGLPNVWHCHAAPNIVQAELGDFGYIDTQRSKTFVRLGNVSELLEHVGEVSYLWLGETVTEGDFGCEWGETTYRYDQGVGGHLRGSVPEQIPLGYINTFFWFHAASAVKHHKIKLQDLVLLSAKEHWWTINVDHGSSKSHTAKDKVIHFHFLPLSYEGKVLSPFGYWSLDSEASPGPWPVLSLPNLRLSCGTTLFATYLSEFHAELLECFSSVFKE